MQAELQHGCVWRKCLSLRTTQNYHMTKTENVGEFSVYFSFFSPAAKIHMDKSFLSLNKVKVCLYCFKKKKLSCWKLEKCGIQGVCDDQVCFALKKDNGRIKFSHFFLSQHRDLGTEKLISVFFLSQEKKPELVVQLAKWILMCNKDLYFRRWV